MSFVGGLVERVIAESDVHRHTGSERAELFHAVNGGSAELEVLEFLYSLVFLFKPGLILETGTGCGLATLAIASAVARNGFGALHTVEVDAGCSAGARAFMGTARPEAQRLTQFHVEKSLDFINRWDGDSFDFVFFDSLLSLRYQEFDAMQRRRLLAPKAVCVFHDTSRTRGETMHDYNPDMIAALDEASRGRQWIENDLSRGVRVLKMG